MSSNETLQHTLIYIYYVNVYTQNYINLILRNIEKYEKHYRILLPFLLSFLMDPSEFSVNQHGFSSTIWDALAGSSMTSKCLIQLPAVLRDGKVMEKCSQITNGILNRINTGRKPPKAQMLILFFFQQHKIYKLDPPYWFTMDSEG